MFLMVNGGLINTFDKTVPTFKFKSLPRDLSTATGKDNRVVTNNNNKCSTATTWNDQLPLPSLYNPLFFIAKYCNGMFQYVPLRQFPRRIRRNTIHYVTLFRHLDFVGAQITMFQEMITLTSSTVKCLSGSCPRSITWARNRSSNESNAAMRWLLPIQYTVLNKYRNATEQGSKVKKKKVDRMALYKFQG